MAKSSMDESDFDYLPDEIPKRKHHWDRNEAGFVEVHGELVAKCPNDLTLERAKELINQGIPWCPKGWKKTYPKRIYVLYNKRVYRAVPTNPGKSYHGFPETPEGLPPEMRKPLRELATQRSCLEEFEKWLNG